MQLPFHNLPVNVTSVLTMSILLLAVAGCGLDRAPRAEKMLESSNQMKELILGISLYRDVNENEWPEELDQIRKYCENNFDELLQNPITGDNPGYEYVMPNQDADPKTTVVIYQLRDGQRDTSLWVGFGDIRVSAIGSQN